MQTLSDLPSAYMLKNLLLILVNALDKEYVPYPDDPTEEFCNAAQDVVFFIGQTLSDLQSQKSKDLNWAAAMNLAVEIGEYQLAKVAADKEAALLLEDSEALSSLTAAIHRVVFRKGLHENWVALCEEQTFKIEPT